MKLASLILCSFLGFSGLLLGSGQPVVINNIEHLPKDFDFGGYTAQKMTLELKKDSNSGDISIFLADDTNKISFPINYMSLICKVAESDDMDNNNSTFFTKNISCDVDGNKTLLTVPQETINQWHMHQAAWIAQLQKKQQKREKAQQAQAQTLFKSAQSNYTKLAVNINENPQTNSTTEINSCLLIINEKDKQSLIVAEDDKGQQHIEFVQLSPDNLGSVNEILSDPN